MRAKGDGGVRFAILSAVGLVLFPFLFHAIDGYAGLATQILMVSIASIGFNLLLGYTGLLSYGHAMFYGGSGYVAALLLIHFMPDHPNLWLAVLGGTIAATLLALLVGALAVRLYGIYFALLTLAFAQMVYFVVEQAEGITGGDDGIQSFPNALLPIGPYNLDLTAALPAFDLGPFGNLNELKLWYVLSAVILFVVLIGMRALTRSQFGEVLTAIRENEERSSLIGFNAAAYRLAAFAISGALTGLSGALRALYDGTVSVESVGIDRSGSFVIYTIVGGVQTLLGPIAGTGVIMYLESVLSARIGYWRLIEGVIFVAVIVFLPNGIIGTMRKAYLKKQAMERAQSSRALLAQSLRARPGGGDSQSESIGASRRGANAPGGAEPGAERLETERRHD
jgi:branched-chain amino acid transport system permease protein